MPPRIIDNPERARLTARAIASDISIYNKEKIAQGIQNDNLFDLMKGEIAEGRELFRSRVTPEIFATSLYDKALVDILLKANAHVKSRIW